METETQYLTSNPLVSGVNNNNEPVLPPPIDIKQQLKIVTLKERLKKREIWINSAINDSLVELLFANLINLQEEGPNLPITVVVNSTGGSFFEAVVATDIMGTISCPVRTIALAEAVSGGFILFMGGKERIAHDYTNLMMHSAGFGITDKVPDIEGRVKHIKYFQEKLAKFFALQTEGRTSIEYWSRLIESGKDKWFSIEEALKLGIVHRVIKRPEMVDPTFMSRPAYTWDIVDIARSQQ